MERLTPQRMAIAAAIAGASRPLSPQEILEMAQASVQGLGIATVYRNLKILLDESLITAVNLPGDSPRYESSGHAHHHHFQCEACGRVFDVHACPGDLSSMAPAGFQVSHHELTLYGLCADCRQSRAARIG